MNAGDKSGRNFHEHELAEQRLAESRDRMKRFRSLENSFAPDSSERIRANTLVEEIEVLHQVLDQLCHQFRHRMALKRGHARGNKPRH